MYSFLYGPLVKKIIPLLDLTPDVSIVDIGGGTGAVAEFIFKLSGQYGHKMNQLPNVAIFINTSIRKPAAKTSQGLRLNWVTPIKTKLKSKH